MFSSVSDSEITSPVSKQEAQCLNNLRQKFINDLFDWKYDFFKLTKKCDQDFKK